MGRLKSERRALLITSSSPSFIVENESCEFQDRREVCGDWLAVFIVHGVRLAFTPLLSIL